MKWIYLIISVFLSIYLNAQKISCSEVPKYLKAFEYIQSDSINNKNQIKVSDMIVDLDRFYFKAYLKNDPKALSILDSLTKYYWFESFNSLNLKICFKKINNNLTDKSVIFFSLIEKNTLRADLFVNGLGLKDYDEIIKKNNDKVYAYLFFFDTKGNVIKAFREMIHYEPF